MIVEWRPEGVADLWEILEYIDERNPQAAEELYSEIERELLQHCPRILTSTA
jgi:plasmid stabilization system protein ParE